MRVAAAKNCEVAKQLRLSFTGKTYIIRFYGM